MRVKSWFVVMVALAITLVPVLATAQAKEDFMYPPPGVVGDPIAGKNGGTGWATPWGTSSPFPNAFRVRNGGLVFPGLLTAGNAAIADFDGALWAYNQRFVTPANAYGTPGTSVWAQYLIRPEPGFGQWGAMVLGQGGFNAQGSVQFGLQADASGRYLFIQNMGAGFVPALQRVPYNYVANKTYLIQAHLTFLPGNQVNVYANVWSTNMGPDTSVSKNGWYWAGPSQQVQLYSSGNYSYDMFYLGDRPDNPIPEAGTMVALGSFLSMGGLFLRRRFAKN